MDRPLNITAPFDGNRAMADLDRLCELGPRPAGSAANRSQRMLVAEHFRSCGGSVREQHFEGRHPLTGQRLPMANLIGSWGPSNGKRLLIGAHGDTRPEADREVDPSRRALPFIGANDGASGVAALMELARGLAGLVGVVGVDLVVFDAEELVIDEVGAYCLGSRAFAESVAADGIEYEAALVLDMVAGESMALRREGFGESYAPELVDEIWGIARALGVVGFLDEVGDYVEDDHLPLLAIGVPSAALVDIEYPQWHTIDDVPGRCSAASIEAVGRVVASWLGRRSDGSRRP